MRAVSIVGGGLGGLVAAITAAEAGARVTLFEAHRSLGGRWRMVDGPHRAHEGPHVVYGDGPLFAWLLERRLIGRTARLPISAMLRFCFDDGNRLRHIPPAGLRRGLRVVRRHAAPVDESFGDWMGRLAGPDAARISASAAGVAVFHPDPGSLSAAFVAERLRRVFALPPAVRYRAGGWGGMVDDLARHARSLGVGIELGARVDRLDAAPTIVATDLEAARRLLGDESLSWPSGRTVLLDLGLRAGRRDAFVVSDLVGAGWLETFSIPDPTLAPAGEQLVQAQLPVGPGVAKADGVARLELLADRALPDWRERVTYRSSAVADGRTGAVDPVGTSWRDRPAVERGDGVFLVGDRVAAPGLLSEVSFNSAIRAARAAVGDSDSARDQSVR